MPDLVYVQMRQSGPDNSTTYEVVDKRRALADRIVSTFRTEAEARALVERLR